MLNPQMVWENQLDTALVDMQRCSGPSFYLKNFGYYRVAEVVVVVAVAAVWMLH